MNIFRLLGALFGILIQDTWSDGIVLVGYALGDVGGRDGHGAGGWHVVGGVVDDELIGGMNVVDGICTSRRLVTFGLNFHSDTQHTHDEIMSRYVELFTRFWRASDHCFARYLCATSTTFPSIPPTLDIFAS